MTAHDPAAGAGHHIGETRRSHEIIRAAGTPAPRGHFSQAIRAGETIYVAGILALDAVGNIIGPNDAGAQTRQIFNVLDGVLEAADLKRTDVVKLVLYLTDLERDRHKVNQVRTNYLGDWRPASTLVEVSGLAADGACVEVEAVAVRA